MPRIVIAIVLVVAGVLTAALYLLVAIVAITGQAVTEVSVAGGERPWTIQWGFAALWVLILAPLAYGALWLVTWPDRLRRANQAKRREKGLHALEGAMLSAASGDARTARKQAKRAADLLEANGAPRLVAAQAAEAAGDLVAAESHYAAMLADQRTEVVGRRGLSAAAVTRGDYATAIVHATEAFAEHPEARWAFELLFDAQIRSGAWVAAGETLNTGHNRGHVVEPAVSRRRAVLLTAEAAELIRANPTRARELFERAAAASAGFAPAVVLGAGLLVEAGRARRAMGLIEAAWAIAPHPALAAAYREAVAEMPYDNERRQKLFDLAAVNPDHRESKILQAETLLSAEDPAASRALFLAVIDEDNAASARMCALMADVEMALGDEAAAGRWAAEAAEAGGEADWSDIDLNGAAFAYERADWARMVYEFGDRGALIHPRHERFERRLLAAPRAPSTPTAAPAPPHDTSPPQTSSEPALDYARPARREG